MNNTHMIFTHDAGRSPSGPHETAQQPRTAAHAGSLWTSARTPHAQGGYTTAPPLRRRTSYKLAQLANLNQSSTLAQVDELNPPTYTGDAEKNELAKSTNLKPTHLHRGRRDHGPHAQPRHAAQDAPTLYPVIVSDALDGRATGAAGRA